MKDCYNCGTQNRADASVCYICGYNFNNDENNDDDKINCPKCGYLNFIEWECYCEHCHELIFDYDTYQKRKNKKVSTMFDCPICKNKFKIGTEDDFNAFACKHCRSIFSYEWDNNKLVISAVKKNKNIPDEIRKAAKIFELEFPISEEDLKKSYHKILAQYHPDKVSHLAKEFIDLSEQRTKEIIKKYELLLSWLEKNK